MTAPSSQAEREEQFDAMLDASVGGAGLDHLGDSELVSLVRAVSLLRVAVPGQPSTLRSPHRWGAVALRVAAVVVLVAAVVVGVRIAFGVGRRGGLTPTHSTVPAPTPTVPAPDWTGRIRPPQGLVELAADFASISGEPVPVEPISWVETTAAGASSVSPFFGPFAGGAKSVYLFQWHSVPADQGEVSGYVSGIWVPGAGTNMSRTVQASPIRLSGLGAVHRFWLRLTTSAGPLRKMALSPATFSSLMGRMVAEHFPELRGPVSSMVQPLLSEPPALGPVRLRPDVTASQVVDEAEAPATGMSYAMVQLYLRGPGESQSSSAHPKGLWSLITPPRDVVFAWRTGAPATARWNIDPLECGAWRHIVPAAIAVAFRLDVENGSCPFIPGVIAAYPSASSASG